MNKDNYFDILSSLILISQNGYDKNRKQANYHYQKFWKISRINREQAEAHLQEYDRYIDICEKEIIRMQDLVGVARQYAVMNKKEEGEEVPSRK